MSNCAQESINNVVFIVDDERFSVNIQKLRDASEYFEAMFCGKYKESNVAEVRLEEVGSEEFRFLYNFIDSGERNLKEITEELLLKVVPLADRFLFPHLVGFCLDEIQERLYGKNITVEKVVETALRFGQENLKDIVTEWFHKTIFNKPTRWTINSCSIASGAYTTFICSEEYYKIVENSHEPVYRFLLDAKDEFLHNWKKELAEIENKRRDIWQNIKLLEKEIYSWQSNGRAMAELGEHFLKVEMLHAEDKDLLH